jgi:hypothetical protein
MRRLIRNGFLAVAMASAVFAMAQEPGGQGGGRGQFAGMQRVAGVVTAVSGDTITVKAEDGTVYQVTTTPNTRVMKDRGTSIKIADLKVGDGVMAGGNMDAPTKTLHAAFVAATDAATLKKMHDDLGKTYITGKVTAIDADNLRMTIQRADGVAQTIGFDETTSFKRGGRGGRGGGGMGMGAGTPPAIEGGESITLADIKVGDSVVGTGAVKAGVFIPGQLNVAAPRAGRGERGGRGAGAGSSGTDGAGAAADAPAAPAKPQQ